MSMSNLFIRLKRNGEWQAVDVMEATADERHEHFKTLAPPALVRWVNALCDRLAQVEREKETEGAR